MLSFVCFKFFKNLKSKMVRHNDDTFSKGQMYKLNLKCTMVICHCIKTNHTGYPSA